MKSAYELALERLEEQGIEKPREGGLAPEIQRRIAEIRQRSEAEIAKLEILLQDQLQSSPDPADHATARDHYTAERRRLEERRERDIEKLRRDA